MKKEINKIFSFCKGFSLIEISIAISVFSIIVAIAVGIFISAIRAQRYNLSYQELLSQTSYAMEYMSRNIRMAKRAGDSSCIPEGTNYQSESTLDNINLKFVNYKNECQEFFWNQINNQLYQNLNGENLPLTSERFKIGSLKFTVQGDVAGEQPKVTIFLDIKDLKENIELKIQTTVSQRNLNVQL